MEVLYTKEQIKALLPHREPILMLDEVIAYEAGVSMTTVKYVAASNAVFEGHFPDFAIMPGVYLVEALAQTGALMMELDGQAEENTDKEADGRIGVLGGCKIRFRKPVFPGTKILLEAKVEWNFTNALSLIVKAHDGNGNIFMSGSIKLTKVLKSQLKSTQQDGQLHSTI